MTSLVFGTNIHPLHSHGRITHPRLSIGLWAAFDLRRIGQCLHSPEAKGFSRALNPKIQIEIWKKKSIDLVFELIKMGVSLKRKKFELCKFTTHSP